MVAFFSFWFAALVAFALLFLFVSLLKAWNTGDAADLVRVLGTFGVMFTFGIGLQAFGRWLARDEADFLIRFLSDTLEAHDVTAT